MSTREKSEAPHLPVTRREFIKGSAVAAALPALGVEAESGNPGAQATSKKPPNIIIIIADQFRWDALGAMGLNSMGLTPHLDSMARRGTLFRSHMTNQPVCAPSRANLFTGQYQNRNGSLEKRFRARSRARSHWHLHHSAPSRLHRELHRQVAPGPRPRIIIRPRGSRGCRSEGRV